MDKEQAVTENQAEEPEKKEDSQPSKRFILNKDNSTMYEQGYREKKSGRKLLIVIIILILLLSGGYFALRRVIQPAPVTTPTPPPVPTPAPTSQPVLNRSNWSLEILNGSGVTGAAKSRADKIQALGYPVVKTGNADKDNYSMSQILVKKELQDQVELVIADLKDIIRIASSAGELKEGTASARIIIGKNNI